MQHLKNARNRDGRVDTRRAAGQEVWGTRSSNRVVWHFPYSMSLARPCYLTRIACIHQQHVFVIMSHTKMVWKDPLRYEFEERRIKTRVSGYIGV
jgi:hypothetical protein